jgi:4-hydroxy-3-methylbut-2-en-1-yl diphosphate reductase
MQILQADVLGMCFGVRDALEILDRVENPAQVTIHGELVHNQAILEDLERRGFHQIEESSRRPLPLTETVLITAHGISDKERQRLLDAGKKLVDTTCPLVRRAHDAAQKLRASGRFVIIIGKRGHVEVRGIVEDLDQFEVVQSVEEVRRYDSMKLGIMCQTTMPERLVQQVRSAIAEKNPTADIAFIDTVCHPTKDHQKALEQLLAQVDVMVVVGGSNSNNTRELARRCRERGVTTYHIQSAQDIDPAWFETAAKVGLTAGTSTLDSTIDDVRETLLQMSPVLV